MKPKFFTTLTLALLALALGVPNSIAQNWAPGEQQMAREVQALFQAQRHEEALLPAQKWVELCERVYGPEHPDTAASLTWLGQIQSHLGQHEVAISQMERALAISEKQGPEHKATLVCLRDLAFVYMRAEQFQKSLDTNKRLLAIRERLSGPEHLDLAKPLFYMAAASMNLGDLKAAISYLTRCLAIEDKGQGPEHASTLQTLNLLGNCYSGSGDHAKAIAFHTRCFEAAERTLGAKNPETITYMANLGVSYQNAGDYAKALDYTKRTLALREEVHGPSDPRTVATRESVGQIYRQMGNNAAADQLLATTATSQQPAAPLAAAPTPAPSNTTVEEYLFTDALDRMPPAGAPASSTATATSPAATPTSERPEPPAAPPAPAQPAAAASAFGVQVSLNGESFDHDRLITATVKSAKAGHLRLYYIDSENNTFQIFPNQFSKDDKITADTTLELPGNLDFVFRAKHPGTTGSAAVREVFYAVVSETPFSDGQEVALATRGAFTPLGQLTLGALKSKGISVEERAKVGIGSSYYIINPPAK